VAHYIDFDDDYDNDSDPCSAFTAEDLGSSLGGEASLEDDRDYRFRSCLS